MEPALEARDLCVEEESGEVVAGGLSFRLERGQAVLVEAPSPAGLRRLLDVLGGLADPAAGEVVWSGVSSRAIAGAPSRGAAYWLERARRLAAAWLTPSASLLHNQTLFENVALPLRYHLELRAAEVARRVQDLLARLRIDHLAADRPAGLARGVRRRAELARALALDPPLLIVDAHALGVDAESATVMVAALAEAVAAGRLAVLGAAGDASALAPLHPRIIDAREGSLPCARP